MKITRNVNGKAVEFELTRDELYSAYEEQEHIFDKADVEDVFDSMLDEEVIENYGISKSIAEGLLDEMAYRMRHYIDKHDMSLESARDEAITDIINEQEGE